MIRTIQRHYARVLRLDKAGVPLSWLSREEAATLIVKGQVLWSLGDQPLEIKGGYNSSGRQSILALPTIVATDGFAFGRRRVIPHICNRILFCRDQNVCLYCGNSFRDKDLTRDHIVPKSMGGKGSWNNLVTACRRCNQRKGDSLPDEVKMTLLAVPFVPNQEEYLVLANRNILVDQMDFLKNGFSENMRVQ